MGLQCRSDGRLEIAVGFQIPVFPRQRKLIRVLAVAAEAGSNQGARIPFCHLRRTDVQMDYSCYPGYSGHTGVPLGSAQQFLFAELPRDRPGVFGHLFLTDFPLLTPGVRLQVFLNLQRGK